MADRFVTIDPATKKLPDVVEERVGEIVPGQAGRLVSVMAKGVDDAVLTVLGDSTGNEPHEWVYRLAVWLGEKFPAYTVSYRLWDHSTQAYAAAVVLQTGTGARTLTVYNVSYPGSSHEYPMDVVRFPKLFPVEPTTVVVSYGYNWFGSTYRYEQLRLAERVLGKYPTVEYVVTAQPPKAPLNADSADHLRRQEDTRTLAMMERWGLIDATRPFVDRGDYSSLIMGDGIHPTVAGFDLWVEQAKRYFAGHRQAPTPNMPPKASHRTLIPGDCFTLSAGTPERSITPGTIVPRWVFKPDEDGMIVGIADIPPSWQLVDVEILWGMPAGSTGDVAWRLDWYPITSAMHMESGKAYAAPTAGPPMAVTVTSNAIRLTRYFNKAAFTGGRPLALRLVRLGTNAADTSPQDASFHGLVIRRAE